MERLRTGWKSWIFGLLGLSVTVGLAGCVEKTGDKTDVVKTPNATGTGKPRVVLVTNSNSDFWSAAEQGMREAGEKLGAEIEMKRNDGTTEGQIRLLEEALGTSDVRGVAVSVIEAEAPGIADAMRKLKEAGKAVITVDSDVAMISDDVRRAYIGTDNAKAGEVAGKAAALVRPQGGDVVVFVGTAAASNANDRLKGFYKGAGDKFHKQLEILEDGADPNKAQTHVQIAITKYPEAGVFLGLYSYNGPRIAEEVSKNPDFRKKISVVTFDLDEQAIAHIEKGDIDVTVCQNPYEIGFQAVRMLKAMAENDKKTLDEMLPNGAKTLDTGVRVIVPSEASPVKGDNVLTIKAMKEWLAAKGLKSS